jgi:hypothetical protein
MKNRFVKYIFLISAVVTFFGCEEDFELKTDYRPKYSLNCIVRADTSVQIATITKSYMVSGFDPYSYHEDPFVAGADIRLWQGDNVFFFSDTLTAMTDTSRFPFLQKSYALRDFTPVENEYLEIRAILGNGKILEASTRFPKTVKWDSASTFNLPVDGSPETFKIAWKANNGNNLHLLRAQVRYKKDGRNSPTETVFIPAIFNGDIPVYPVPTKNTGVEFRSAAFDRVMREISNGQPDKSSIIIYGVLLELLVFDENLSKYVSNLSGFMDDFTIRVDDNDFTNVSGGLGVFGSYVKVQGGIQIKKEYIQSLGYTPATN